MSLAMKVARSGMIVGRPMGDPGFFGDVFGGIRKVGGAVLGAAKGAATNVFRSISQGSIPTPLTVGSGAIAGAKRGLARGSRGIGTVSDAVNNRLQLGGFAGRTDVSSTRFEGGLTVTPGQNGACPKGFRLNKSSYFLKNGTFVEAGTKCVRIRHRNFGNTKATRRAIAQIKGAKRLKDALGDITVRNRCGCGTRRAPRRKTASK